MDHSPIETHASTGRWSRVASALWLAVLAAALALHVWFPRIDPGAVNDTYNVDVGGRNAFFQFAQRRTPYATRNHESLANAVAWLDEDTTVCLLGPARYPSQNEWSALLGWVQRGGKLLFAARWDDAALAIPGIDARVTSKEKKSIFEELQTRQSRDSKNAPVGGRKKAEADKSADDEESTPSGPLWTSLTPDANFTWKTEGAIDAPGAEVLVKTGESPQVVRIHYGGGTIILAASDYIFSNTALFDHDHRNGVLAVKLLEAAGTADAVLFDESLNETGTQRVVGILLDPALRPATLQFIVILVLFGWRGNRRFGGLLPYLAPARHDVADHTNSLGNLYYKAHHATGVLREYLEQLRTELKLRYVAGREQRVLAAIARNTKVAVEEVQRTLTEAEAAARKPKLSRREAAANIRKLARLRQPAGKV